MKAYLRRPDLVPAPAAYRQYLIERRMWQEFGAPQPPLDGWPVRKVAEYTCIQRAIDEVDLERRRATANHAPSLDAGPAPQPGPRPVALSGRAAATEATFQRLRAQAQPPPMPPQPPSTPPTATA